MASLMKRLPLPVMLSPATSKRDGSDCFARRFLVEAIQCKLQDSLINPKTLNPKTPETLHPTP